MRYLLASFLTFTTLIVNAQLRKVSTDKVSKSNYPISLSIQPLFLYNNCLKLDGEVQQKEKASALIGGVEIYAGKILLLYKDQLDNDNNNNDYINGTGINIAYKIKLNKSEKLTSFYFSPGFTLRNLKITTNGDGFYTYNEGGVEYYTYGNIEKENKIQSALIYGNVGYHKVWTTSLLLDTYLGFGYKKATENKDLEFNRNYEKPIYGFNYSGVTIQAGIKLGFQLK